MLDTRFRFVPSSVVFDFSVLMLVIAWRKLDYGSIKCSPPPPPVSSVPECWTRAFVWFPPNVGFDFFGGGSGGSKSCAIFLVGGVMRCLFGVGRESGISSARSTLVLCCTGVFAVGYVTRGKE
jgi:hypothetical protein